MRYLTQVFQPLINIPKNAKIKNTEITCKSQKLLLECGLIRPTTTGLYTILPLARRALNKLETLITSTLDNVGGQQVTLPSLVERELWETTGRAGGSELWAVTDRHDKKFVLAPTHEESIADLVADVGPLSYKQLPLLLYQISQKYRDEHRPKHGILRAREFSMLDAYSLHTNNECTETMYNTLSQVYSRIFNKLALEVHRVKDEQDALLTERETPPTISTEPSRMHDLKRKSTAVKAPSGEMGGTLSHEWQICASAGEDCVYICPSCSNTTLEERDSCSCGGNVEKKNSIEVGHTFILGTKYSDSLKSNFVSGDGKTEPVIMSCYGIGITRLLAASLEALSTEQALRWPKHIAPFDAIVIGPKEGSKEWSAHGPDKLQKVCQTITNMGKDVILDDRHNMTIGKRMIMADRMGYPTIIVCGRSTLESPPRYEVHRTGSEPILLTLEQISGLENDKIKCEN